MTIKRRTLLVARATALLRAQDRRSHDPQATTRNVARSGVALDLDKRRRPFEDDRSN